MANEGYIKLYRRMMKWGWYTDTPTKCVFLHLLFLACYEPCYYKGVHLETGQAVASIRQISNVEQNARKPLTFWERSVIITNVA